MRDISEIQADIDKVKLELQTVRGTESEVYTRIVGYYRSVRNWNKGKRDEYNKRRLFDPALVKCTTSQVAKPTKVIEKPSYLELYTKPTCPNCPSVIEFCKGLNIEVKSYNVDEPENKEKALKKSIRQAPTVILYDGQGNETSRAYSVSDLKSVFAS